MTGAPQAVLGLDFGTTNSVAARVGSSGQIETLRFPEGDIAHELFRSALCFMSDPRVAVDEPVTGGPWAIARFVAHPDETRFLQSFKTFAASATFRSTTIRGSAYRFEDLLRVFLEQLLKHADTPVARAPQRLVVGRPVSFAGGLPNAALAQARYDAAFTAAGFTDVHYAYEPVAAAFWFAQRLTHDATVLVADFGGGTSDFSIVRFAVGPGGITAHPLAQTGIGLAGDRFDYRIIDHIISPKLGKGSRYKSFDKMLAMPNHYYANFARWNQLAIMKSAATLRELRQLARASDEPERLEMLIEMIENDLGYPLYKAVSDLKTTLSAQDSAAFHFRNGDIDIAATVTRADFERWIAPDLKAIDGSVAAALVAADIEANDIDKVFLTGGTSFVPAVRSLFEHRFPRDRIETGDQLVSIANGLALIGAEPDIARWTVREEPGVSTDSPHSQPGKAVR